MRDMQDNQYASNLGPDYFDRFMDYYVNYQQRFAKDMAERDKVLLRLIGEILHASGARETSLLDVGCSTGNLLYHLKGAFPQLRLAGGDIASDVIEGCRKDPKLQGIRFDTMDVFDLEGSHDIIVANAVAQYFENRDYERIVRSVGKALKPGGSYVSFEWLHPFLQDVQITETSKTHPQGIRLNARPYATAERILREQGFTEVRILPFSIPVDLPIDGSPQRRAEVYEEIHSYTLRTETGQRLLFRGGIFQPWCHLVAHKGIGGA